MSAVLGLRICNSIPLRRRPQARTTATTPSSGAAPRSGSSARTAAGFAPRCRFRRSKPAVRSQPSPTFATSPPKRTVAHDWRCFQRSPTGPTAPWSSPIPTGESSISTRRLPECSATHPRKRRDGSRASCWWVAIPTPARWQSCKAGSVRKTAARRKSSPTTRTATRSGSRPTSRRSATPAAGSNTCSRC